MSSTLSPISAPSQPYSGSTCWVLMPVDPKSVEQPVQLVVGVVQVKADAHCAGTDRRPNAGPLKPLGCICDRYRHDRRILLGQNEFCTRPIGKPDGVRLDGAAVKGRKPRQRQPGAQRTEPGG